MMMGVGAAPLPTVNRSLRPRALLLPRTPISRHSPLSSLPAIIRSDSRRHLSVSATSRRRKEPAGVGDGADYSDGDDGWEDTADEEEEGEEGGESMPFQEMRRWLQNKPKGFGEGKNYDCTLEEELMEEIERSREAQLANITKLRKGEPKKQEEPRKKEIDVVPSGIRVRVSNLPRKKNIHRDMRAAFKGFPGIVSISPAVIGNQKTRDPICKGFAFVDLESEEAAERFVQKYSKQILIFGKVQKQITCDVISPQHSFSSPVQSTDDNQTFGQLESTGLQAEIPENSEINNYSGDSIVADDQTIQVSTLPVNETDRLSLEIEKAGTSIDLEISHFDDVENIRPNDEGDIGSKESSSLSQKRMKQKSSRKKIVKLKSTKPSILDVSGSMTRLKVKERTVLTGALSKYGVSTNTLKQG